MSAMSGATDSPLLVCWGGRLWVQLSFLCARCARCRECPGFCFSHLSRRSRGSPDHSPLCPFVSFVVTAFPDLGDDVAISPVSAIPPLPPATPKTKDLRIVTPECPASHAAASPRVRIHPTGAPGRHDFGLQGWRSSPFIAGDWH